MATLLPRSHDPGAQPAHSPATPTFGTLLKHYRLAAGLSQESLAERARLSIRGISDLERGMRRLPRRDTLSLLIVALVLAPPDQRAFEAAASGLASAPLLVMPYPRSNVPSPPTSLIGRAEEFTDALASLRSEDVRLLTLTGAGGVGKTRLAQAVGGALLPDFAECVWQIELASVRDPRLVIAAIAGVIGVAQTGGTLLLESLIGRLREARALLLLDNFEHLLNAAPIVALLLQSCPLVRLLVTSRAPLHVRGEHEVLVRPFAVPDSERLPALGE
ncbi:MAG: helix-turn-helix domain-containing protein, partial [Chloroflexota bacterium]